MSDMADLAQETLDRQDEQILNAPTLQGFSFAKRPEPKPALTAADDEAPYGRKANGEPYKRRPSGSAGVARSEPKNTQLAKDAAEVLVRFNTLLGTGLMMAGFFETAGLWISDQEQFRSQAVASLENDPALCRSILRTGAKGGKFGLFAAYAVLIGGVSATAVGEYKRKQDDREPRD